MRWLLPALAITALVAAPSARAADAVALQLNPAHTGAAREPGLDPPLHRAWERRFKRPVSYPLIADGRVFVTVPNGLPYQHGGSRLIALSARTGRTLWQRDVGGEHQRAAAAYDAGRVYALNDDTDLLAFRAESGQPLWRRDFGTGISTGPPVATGGVVYAVMSEMLQAVDGATGELRWRAGINGTDDAAPVVAGDRVFASFVGPQVYAFERATGALVWHSAGDSHGGGADTAALYRGRLYVRDWASRPHGYVYDAVAGSMLGRFHSDVEPAFARGSAYLVDARVRSESIDLGGTLVALDLARNRARWRFRGDGELQSAPLVVNRTVYVGSGTGRLYGLDARNGRLRWRTHLAESISAPPFAETPRALAAGGGTLVVPATRRLVAFR